MRNSLSCAIGHSFFFFNKTCVRLASFLIVFVCESFARFGYTSPSRLCPVGVFGQSGLHFHFHFHNGLSKEQKYFILTKSDFIVCFYNLYFLCPT